MGINEVETQEGGSRWLERRLWSVRGGGAGQRWGQRPGRAPLWLEKWPLGPRGEEAGAHEARTPQSQLGSCLGLWSLCFNPEENPAGGVHAPHGLGTVSALWQP